MALTVRCEHQIALPLDVRCIFESWPDVLGCAFEGGTVHKIHVWGWPGIALVELEPQAQCIHEIFNGNRDAPQDSLENRRGLRQCISESHLGALKGQFAKKNVYTGLLQFGPHELEGTFLFRGVRSGWHLWQAHSYMLEVLFGKEAIATVVGCNGDYSGAQHLVSALASESALGAALFRTTAVSVTLVEFQRELSQLISTCVAEPFTMARMQASQRKIQALVDDYIEKGLPQVSRELSLPYLSFKVTLLVTDFAWEAHIRLWAEIKARCVGRPGGLPAMQHEAWFLPSTMATFVIDKEIYLEPCLHAQWWRICYQNILLRASRRSKMLLRGPR